MHTNLTESLLLKSHAMKSMLAISLAIAIACISECYAQSGSPLYTAAASCEVDQVCSYKYTAVQQQFGKEQDNAISITATVGIQCNSVGLYNETAATEYCMDIKEVNLDGPMFSDSEEKTSLENFEDESLAGWFCFIQTFEGKVVSIFHDSNAEPHAVNLKKSIAAAFQANFKGTEVEEETDPQSKHISHYSYTTSEEEGVQKMHRSINSEDVEEYPNDDRPHEVELHKEEDIEFQHGILQSSSGTTYVAINTHQQQEGDENDSDQNEPKMFAVVGSYKLDKDRCYSLSGKEKQQRKRRSADNLVETTLSATIDKRSIARQNLEDLRQQIPSPLDALMKFHKNPKNIHIASKLQRMLVLEAEHGLLPGTTPALTDVLIYLKKLSQSQDAEHDEIKKTIHSLLAHEGTLKSQMALLDVLLHGSDKEQDSVITHIAFTTNAHIDFIKELEALLTTETTKSDSLLLAYSALASTASSTSGQHRIVDFLKERLSQHMEVNDTSNTVHLLHAFGNTGSERVIDQLLDYYWHSDSEEVKLAAIGGMRKLTGHKLVQDAFATILRSTKDEAVVEEITKTLLLGLEYSHQVGVHMQENTNLLNALVDSCLQHFSNSTQLHHLVHSYLQAVNTVESHRLAELLIEKTGLTRARRASTSDWDASSSLYNLIASQSARRSDVDTYPHHRAYLWGRKLGISDVNVQLVAGLFAGTASSKRGKLFGKAIAKGTLFGRSNTIGEAYAEARTFNESVGVRIYAKIGGNVLVNIAETRNCCLNISRMLPSSRHRIIRFKHSIFVYVGTIDFYVELNAYLNVKVTGEVCLGHSECSGPSQVSANIMLTPDVHVSPEGEAKLTFLALIRIGISLSGSVKYQLESNGSAQICYGSSCHPKLKACAVLYHSWPQNNIDLFAWYQIRRLFSGWRPRKRCCISEKWNLEENPRSRLYNNCITK